MNKNKGILIVFAVIFVIGMMVLMNSVDLGHEESMDIMSDQDGIMDTGNYLIYLEQSITKYRFIGSILSILGGLGILQNKQIKE